MTHKRALDIFLIGAFLLPTAARWSGMSDLASAWLGSPLQALALIAAAALAFRVAHALREVPGARRHWSLFATGLLLFAVGEGWDAVYEFPGATRPIPSPPDLLYLGGYVLIPLALAGFLRAYRSFFPVSSERELKLTALGVGAALIALAAFVIGPVLERPLPLPEKVYLTSYSVLDIGLIAPLVLLVRTVYSFRGGLVARAWGMLLFGFLIMATADLLFSLTPWLEGTSLYGLDDVAYLAAYLLLLKGVALHLDLVA